MCRFIFVPKESNILVSMQTVPRTLRLWFIAHFIIDAVTAIPIFIWPAMFNRYTSLPIDPVAVRLLASAMLAIGITSLLTVRRGVESYKTFLILKIIWSSLAIIGLLLNLSLLSSGGYNVLITFIILDIAWGYYLIRLR